MAIGADVLISNDNKKVNDMDILIDNNLKKITKAYVLKKGQLYLWWGGNTAVGFVIFENGIFDHVPAGFDLTVYVEDNNNVNNLSDNFFTEYALWVHDSNITTPWEVVALDIDSQYYDYSNQFVYNSIYIPINRIISPSFLKIIARGNLLIGAGFVVEHAVSHQNVITQYNVSQEVLNNEFIEYTIDITSNPYIDYIIIKTNYEGSENLSIDTYDPNVISIEEELGYSIETPVYKVVRDNSNGFITYSNIENPIETLCVNGYYGIEFSGHIINASGYMDVSKILINKISGKSNVYFQGQNINFVSHSGYTSMEGLIFSSSRNPYSFKITQTMNNNVIDERIITVNTSTNLHGLNYYNNYTELYYEYNWLGGGIESKSGYASAHRRSESLDYIKTQQGMWELSYAITLNEPKSLQQIKRIEVIGGTEEPLRKVLIVKNNNIEGITSLYINKNEGILMSDKATADEKRIWEELILEQQDDVYGVIVRYGDNDQSSNYAVLYSISPFKIKRQLDPPYDEQNASQRIDPDHNFTFYTMGLSGGNKTTSFGSPKVNIISSTYEDDLYFYRKLAYYVLTGTKEYIIE